MSWESSWDPGDFSMTNVTGNVLHAKLKQVTAATKCQTNHWVICIAFALYCGCHYTSKQVLYSQIGGWLDFSHAIIVLPCLVPCKKDLGKLFCPRLYDDSFFIMFIGLIPVFRGSELDHVLPITIFEEEVNIPSGHSRFFDAFRHQKQTNK